MPTPSCSAASMIRRFFGTATVSPFSVMVTVSFCCSFANCNSSVRYEPSGSDGDRRGLRAADQRQVFFAELLERARDRCGGRVAQHANRRARHVTAELDELVEVFDPAVTVLDAAQHL